jgi:hypothetical protein
MDMISTSFRCGLNQINIIILPKDLALTLKTIKKGGNSCFEDTVWASKSMEIKIEKGNYSAGTIWSYWVIGKYQLIK